MTRKKLFEKMDSWKKLTIKEHKWLFRNLVKEADTLFNSYIRERDQSKGCVSYWADNCKNKAQNACHFIPCEYYSHRWDESNVYWWCANCNWFNKQQHQQYFTYKLIDMYWKNWVNKLQSSKNKIKPTIDELLTIISKYKKDK